MKTDMLKARSGSATSSTRGSASGTSARPVRATRKFSEVTPPRMIPQVAPARKFSEATPPKGILKGILKLGVSEESLTSTSPKPATVAEEIPEEHQAEQCKLPTPSSDPRMRKTSRVHFDDEKLIEEIPQRHQQWSPEPDYPLSCQPAFKISSGMSVEAKYLIMKSYEDELLEKIDTLKTDSSKENRDSDSDSSSEAEEEFFKLELDACDKIKRDRNDVTDISPDPYIVYGRLLRLVEKVRDEKRSLLRSNEEFLRWFQSLRMALDELDTDDL